jgi:hypothetical protein
VAANDCDDDLSPLNLPLQVSVAVIVTGPIVAVLANGLVRSQFLQPILVILVYGRLGDSIYEADSRRLIPVGW